MGVLQNRRYDPPPREAHTHPLPLPNHSNVIGFLFPAYYSFKAIESPNKEDDKQWYVA